MSQHSQDGDQEPGEPVYSQDDVARREPELPSHNAETVVGPSRVRVRLRKILQALDPRRRKRRGVVVVQDLTQVPGEAIPTSDSDARIFGRPGPSDHPGDSEPTRFSVTATFLESVELTVELVGRALNWPIAYAIVAAVSGGLLYLLHSTIPTVTDTAVKVGMWLVVTFIFVGLVVLGVWFIHVNGRSKGRE